MSRGRAPAWLKRWLLKCFPLPVLRQDRRAPARQADAIAAAGEVDYAVGPLDLLGPAIWRFANGVVPDAESYERSIAL